MAAPDLNDPAQRAAYARELAGVARRIRLAGVVLAVIGAVLMLLQRRGFDAVPLWLAASVMGAGAMLMVTAIAARRRYHRLRMQG
ncbi:hypothetical protein [Sphingomonas hengshuiensis]|uniref:Uncharacterized protein n=1 Tax=Sphingomonas hengshuiensis TaxID=1609977 RepID=A0A7U4J695_9SPHN|nr:hypothetical protein [Sphingomonas hengshuiensis]AJP71021.1 hypothetical protein TS85_03060 [Sphingomonas hengshuiensis]